MRDIFFRGKHVDNGEWVHGFYVCVGQHHYIFTGVLDITGLFPSFVRYEVDSATVGQYTGLTDKNGKKIFEGDILLDNHVSVQKPYSVIYFSGSFVRRTADGNYLSLSVLNEDEFEIIGNIYDNSELLK